MTKKTLAFRITMIVYLIVVGVLCFVRLDGMEQAPGSIFGIEADKIVHFIMFLPFAPLAFLSIGKKAPTPWRAMLVTLSVFLLGCVMAGATELIQGMTGYRTADAKDFVADTLALCLGSVIVIVLEASKRHEK